MCCGQTIIQERLHKHYGDGYTMDSTQRSDIVQYDSTCIAVLSDIHSNDVALAACLEDAKEKDVDCFVFLGDYISGLAAPIKTMDLVYEIRKQYPTCCIRGNRERYILDHRNGVNICVPGSNTGTFFFTSKRLREKDVSFFTELPIFDRIEINGIIFEVAHAVKENDRYYFEKDDARIDGVIKQMDADYLLCGHSHKQYLYQNHGKKIINPGSVGLPQGSDSRAQYLLLKLKNGMVSCDFRQVPYDIECVIQTQFESGLVDEGRCWAISDLYGAITGKEYTKTLLEKMYRYAQNDKNVLADEQVWNTCAASLGMRFTENEILAFWRTISKRTDADNI